MKCLQKDYSVKKCEKDAEKEMSDTLARAFTHMAYELE